MQIATEIFSICRTISVVRTSVTKATAELGCLWGAGALNAIRAVIKLPFDPACSYARLLIHCARKEQWKQDCPNGRLTPAKFVDMYKMFFPSGNAEEFCDHVFRTFDMDKNGYIDFKTDRPILGLINVVQFGVLEHTKNERHLSLYTVHLSQPRRDEFLLAIDVTSSGTPEEKLKWAFRMYDVDGNGVIDIQEMTKIVQAIYDMLGACSSNRPADSAEDRAKNIFAKMDENNDGQLTQDEFLKGCLQDEELSKMLAP
ncbi:unnamed protein product [Brassicogethes aeneus]|uniref:EF-hand domain-containing protein n=2 Tax=Neoptera TaxID=33340 RepID=A0A9P0FC66_BRAAE|nr:unnamed protein product [Brassicogethes aeneus]